MILADSWYDIMRPQVLRLLSFPTVQVVVAYNPENDDLKSRDYGWLAYERADDLDSPLLLYAYIKEPVRRMGLANRLLKEAGLHGSFRYACKTKDGERWLRGTQGKWAPRAARRRRRGGGGDT